jgi:hypothetical protein
MPRISFPLFATIALSFAVWLFFRVTMPDHPLSPGEMAVLVLVASLLVGSRRRLGRAARRVGAFATASLAGVRRASATAWSQLGWRSDDPAA